MMSTLKLIAQRQCGNQIRSTYVFRHLRILPNTPEGKLQRSPKEKQSYNYFEVVRNEAELEPKPIKVILCEYVEGYGNRGDIVEVPADFGRFELLLLGKAVYASPFNLNMFEAEKKKLDLEDRKPIKLTKFSLTIGKSLRHRLHLVRMNMRNTWTLSEIHVKLSLRAQNIHVSQDSIVLPPEPISRRLESDQDSSSGDLSQHGQLFRFYLIINRIVIVPCTGRLMLVDSDWNRSIIDPGLDYTQCSDEEKRQAGIDLNERVYVHTDFLPPDFDKKAIWNLMQKKAALKEK